MITKLFVVGFPRDMSEVGLLELFSHFGQVASLNIVRDKGSSVSLGYGFVEMTDEVGAKRAVAGLHQFKIGDRTLNVRINDKRPVFEMGNQVNRSLDNKKKRPRRQV